MGGLVSKLAVVSMFAVARGLVLELFGVEPSVFKENIINRVVRFGGG